MRFTRCTHGAFARYRARYAKRTSISGKRMIEAADEVVRFGYTDSDTHQRREPGWMPTSLCAGNCCTCLRPAGRHRVRFFGWLHPAAKLRRMKIENVLAKLVAVRVKPPERPDWSRCCPHCHKFSLVMVGPHDE